MKQTKLQALENAADALKCKINSIDQEFDIYYFLLNEILYEIYLEKILELCRTGR
jgi:hypothetical protein